jgi:hypothetical protein
MPPHNNANKNRSYAPTIDAGWGLIMRLNYLWAAVDRAALEGDTDKWDFLLDRLYCNLLYRNKLNAVYDDWQKEKLKSIELFSEDTLIYKDLKLKIRKAKNDKIEAMRKKDRKAYNVARELLYDTIMLKDIWLRKFMHEQKLYLKESDFNPNRAMFGG